MTRPRRATTAFMLVELMMLVVCMAAVAGLLTVMVCDAFYLQRVAAARADRLAVCQSLTRELRRDALTAVGHDWDGSTLALAAIAPDGRHDVRYAISTQTVVRTEDGAETHVWRALRLEFTGRLEVGDAANVFFLKLIELPAPRGGRRSPRSVEVPVLLTANAARGAQ